MPQEAPHEHEGPDKADDKTDGQHDHRYAQPEAKDHQDEPDNHGRQVAENPFARLQPPTPTTDWLCWHRAPPECQNSSCQRL